MSKYIVKTLFLTVLLSITTWSFGQEVTGSSNNGYDSNNNGNQGPVTDCAKVQFINLDVVGNWLNGWDHGFFTVTFIGNIPSYTVGPFPFINCTNGSLNGGCCCYGPFDIYGNLVAYPAQTVTITTKLVEEWTPKIYQYTLTCSNTGIITIDGNSFPKPPPPPPPPDENEYTPPSPY